MIPLESHHSVERLSKSVADELVIMEPSSDAGVVPLYSILGELVEVLKPDEAAFQESSRCLDGLSDVLDKGGIPSPAFIQELKDFYERLEYFVRYYGTGETIGWAELQSFWKKEEAEVPAGTDGLAATMSEDPAAGSKGEEASNAGAEAPGFEDQLMVVDLKGSRDVLEEFYQEAEEHLGQIEAALLDLEGDLRATEPIRTMFRSFHTIKGVAGFLDLSPMRYLAHEIETLLDLIRSDKLAFTEVTITLVLESRDRLHLLVQQVYDALNENTQPSRIIPVRDLIVRAQKVILEGEDLPAASTAASGQRVAPEALPDSEVATPGTSDALRDDSLVAGEGTMYGDQEVEPAGEALLGERESETASAGKAEGAKKVNATIRMNTDKLDSIIEAVGELVIVESQLAVSIEALEHGAESRVTNNLRQLKRITRELQMSSMSLRMVSLKPLFQKMQRLARDVASKSGKKIKFRIEGEDTEMDRTVVEQIGDALVHMIRNSVDHGIERPEERLAKGKSEYGDILLKASYAGQNIVLELQDDGAGIVSENVLGKARKRGLATEDKEYTREEILQMIFLPGFSTVETVSDFSGRGVGMDVVRSNVQMLRGRVDLSSTEGRGSKLSIALPLTMAIIDGLLVQCGEHRYVVPVSAIVMTLKPDPKQVFEVQSRGRVIKHRDKIFKLVFMSDLFGIQSDMAKASDGIVIIIETAICDYGLVVDNILHKQEVVIKQLGAALSETKGVSGGAILGDGTVALILDPSAMAEMCKDDTVHRPVSA